MTNVSNKMLFAFAVFVSATVLSLGAFATTVQAADYGEFDLGGGGGYDYGSYDLGGYDYGSYDVGGYDYGSYDIGGYDYGNYDVGGYDYGNYDVSGYDYGNYDVSGYDYGNYDVSGYDYGNYDVSGYDYGNYDVADQYDSYDQYEQYDAYETYQDQYMQEWATQQQQQYSMGNTQSYQTGGGYSTPSYPRPTTPTPGCTRNCVPPPTGCTHNCYPTPTPVCPSGTTGTYPNCKYPTPPGCTHNCNPTPTPCSTCGGSNTNTNINTNTNTWIDNSIVDNSIVDNSINGSFNTTITTLGYVQPQPIIQYQQQNAAPYCVITLTNTGAYNAQATLVWSSSNAHTAYISQVGSVAPNGTRVVTGYANQIYSLTVTGQGGSYTCQTQQYTPTYVPPTITPSVSLTQIPYTGLALSPFAQAMYWLSLLSVAAAGGYLLVYYKGGALALAGASMTRRSNHFVVSEQETEEVAAPEVTEIVEEEVVAAPAVSTFSLPTMVETKTRDTMQMIRNASGVPQLIINRA